MRNDIPGIDDLTRGINDADMAFGVERPQAETNGGTQQGGTNSDNVPTGDKNDNGDACWIGFLAHAWEATVREGREERLACKLDRDLADSLDDCDIHNRCRSDLVNAIVRAFFEAYLPRLAKYRREKKSLFTGYRGKGEFENPDNK